MKDSGWCLNAGCECGVELEDSVDERHGLLRAPPVVLRQLQHTSQRGGRSTKKRAEGVKMRRGGEGRGMDGCKRMVDIDGCWHTA